MMHTISWSIGSKDFLNIKSMISIYQERVMQVSLTQRLVTNFTTIHINTVYELCISEHLSSILTH